MVWQFCVTVAVGLLLAVGSMLAGESLPGQPVPELDALFQRTNGWIGADAAYSIRLSAHTTLWLFGDTFLGEIANGRRTSAVMVNNTVGLQRSTNRPEFFHGATRDGKSEAFFKPEDGRGYFWPMHGVRIGDGLKPRGGNAASRGLWLFLHQIENVKTDGPFGFKAIGCWLVHVPNPDDLPDSWKVSQVKVPFTEIGPEGALFFGGGVMRDGQWVYIGGTDSRPETKKRFGHGGLALARAPASRLGDFKQWRFLAKGKWQKDFKKVTPAFADVASEFSLSYLPGAKRYAAVYMAGGIFGTIHVRLATAPEGPWSEPRAVFRCPELDWPIKAFCYSAKAHPELATSPDELVITYAANSWDFGQLFSEPRLYWPRFVRVRISGKFQLP
jgi:hypothetical protein